jgi:hypothetical protein
MFGFEVICWALLFIFQLRFPPGVPGEKCTSKQELNLRILQMFVKLFYKFYSPRFLDNQRYDLSQHFYIVHPSSSQDTRSYRWAREKCLVALPVTFGPHLPKQSDLIDFASSL